MTSQYTDRLCQEDHSFAMKIRTNYASQIWDFLWPRKFVVTDPCLIRNPTLANLCQARIAQLQAEVKRLRAATVPETCVICAFRKCHPELLRCSLNIRRLQPLSLRKLATTSMSHSRRQGVVVVLVKQMMTFQD